MVRSPLIPSAQRPMARCLSWTVYPLVVVLSVATLWLLLRCGAALSWAPYVAAAVAGMAVFAAEAWLPYRATWRPTWTDVLEDGTFLAITQVGVPFALGWATVWLLQAFLADHGMGLGLWPAHFPIWAQVLLKLAAGDFLRYWLHRWSHEWSPLWRWHAPHHQPRKLYGWNVFRFHPADKAFQFVFDSLPFIVLGMGRESFAYYFVIYATSGFLQHANCDVRLGWFNYLLSGPEVHRWHHAADLADANHNYAHTIVLWDVLFGTYHRPSREIGALGLSDPNYPSSVAGQLAAPFRRHVVETSNADF